jgi:C1A family cysteine protease
MEQSNLQQSLTKLNELEHNLEKQLSEVKKILSDVQTQLTENKEHKREINKNSGGIKRRYGHIGKCHNISGEKLTLNHSLSVSDLPAEVNLVEDKAFFKIGGEQQPYDQGQLGSCTANALAFCFAYDAYKQDPVNLTKTFMPSRLDIYYQERLHMGKSYVNSDSGANISDTQWVLANVGVVPESDWTYYDSSTDKTFDTVPLVVSETMRTKTGKGQMYSVDQTEFELKNALNSGYPIVFGISVYESFESENVLNTGIVPMPNTETEQLMGGHAVVLVGYTSDGYFLVRNSWGVNWGLGFCNEGKYNYDNWGGKMRGYFKLPVAFVTNPNFANSFYAVKSVLDTTETEKSSKVRPSLGPTYDTRCSTENPCVPSATVFLPQ